MINFSTTNKNGKRGKKFLSYNIPKSLVYFIFVQSLSITSSFLETNYHILWDRSKLALNPSSYPLIHFKPKSYHRGMLPQQKRAAIDGRSRRGMAVSSSTAAAAIEKGRSRRAAIENSTQLCSSIAAFLLRPPQQPAEVAAEATPHLSPKQQFCRRNGSAFIRPVI